MSPDIRDQCRGRWPSILMNLGMDAKYLNPRKHSECPECGGKDRYRFTNHEGNGGYICSQCGSGDGMTLAMNHLGLPFKEACNAIRQILGVTKLEPVKQPDTEKNTARIKKIHSGLKRITPDNAAGLYLLRRGITEFPRHNVYFHPAITYYEDGVNIGTFPAMVGMIRTPEWELSTLHITYLNANGTKADVSVGKKILPTMLPMTGAAIELFLVKDVMAIAEGIESACSFVQIEGIPCWSVINSAGMSKFSPPEGVKKIYVIADEDSNFCGTRAAYEVANRLSIKGLDVCVVRLLDKEPFYDSGDKYDFNDYLVLKSQGTI